MTNPSGILHSLELDELVQTYKKLVEKWAKLRYSTKPLPRGLDSRPYLDEIKRRGEGSNPRVLQLLDHPDLVVSADIAMAFMEAEIEQKLARAVLWEVARIHGTAGINASMYLAMTDREWQIKNKVPSAGLDDPTPEDGPRIGGQAKWSLDSQRLGKRPQDKN